MRYDTNLGLARARARTVADLLIEASKNDVAIHKLDARRIVLAVTGPAYTPRLSTGQGPDFDCKQKEESRGDRTVRIWIPDRQSVDGLGRDRQPSTPESAKQ
jgi:hypothetical protein